METAKFTKGQTIYNENDTVEHISIITEGEVMGVSVWHTFKLSQSGFIGLCDLAGGKYSYTYTACSDVTVCKYPCKDIDSLTKLIQNIPDVAYLMTGFACKYINDITEYKKHIKQEIEAIPALISELSEEYSRLCKLYSKPCRALPENASAPQLPGEDNIPDWVYSYYTEINSLGADVRKAFYRGNPGIINGFLHTFVGDVNKIRERCAAYHNYLVQITKTLMGSNEGADLFSYISQLHISTSDNEGADFAIDTLMGSLEEHLSNLAELHVISSENLNKRLGEYRNMLEDSREAPGDVFDILGGTSESEPADLSSLPINPEDELFSSAFTDTQGSIDSILQSLDTQSDEIPKAAEESSEKTDTAGNAENTESTDNTDNIDFSAFDDDDFETPPAHMGDKADANDVPLNPKLTDSLKEILTYSEADAETVSQFTAYINEFKNLPDRNSPEDEVCDLRRNITKAFYVIYKLIITKSLTEKTLPPVINMFLNFGYVDGNLAGHENANYLFEIAGTFKGDPSKNVFTMREWLTSIYKGERDPSLSEFDMDYTAYLRDLKNSKQITPAQEKEMLADKVAKLNYEMDNAFPVVNRVTFGNPSKFCPVFSSHNLYRNIKDALILPSAVVDIIDEVRNIDFSAFYRETSYSDSKLGGVSEHINVEVLPNIILTPTVGLRGSMWQDVEGRIRTTPARMFMPTFLENDLKLLVLKLIAEFRWEICRRIQGTRWNDMTDPSLTSYFCDYLQFYTNNRNISMQTMTEIRNEISAARNNYKTVFVKNYAMWILNESKGMARLNNISLGILMTFCPFTAEIRKRLETNMRFREALNRYNVRQQKKVTHFSNLIKKLQQNSKPVPPEIKAELEFWYK